LEEEKQWLEECRKSIELTLGWGNSHLWGNDDFERLSEKIWEKTGIRLSVSTLKRIWGRVRYPNFPNSATLNALVGFLDYSHWRDFCQTHPLQEPNNSAIPELSPGPAWITPPAKKSRESRTGGHKVLALGLIAGTGILIVLGSWLVLRHKTRRESIVASNFSFSSRKVSDDLPNSVVFNYDASAAKDSKLMIQQSWDINRRETIDNHGTEHTSIYYYPGYFMAKLLVDGRIVKETPVFIQTHGWKGIIRKKPLPIYLRNEEIRPGKEMSITDSLLVKELNTNVFNGLWVQFANIREFPGIEANNFVLETTFRNTSTVEESLCRKVEIEILGTENVIIIPFSTLGCISDLNLFSGDRGWRGKEHDLSAFGCDFTQFQEMKCVVSARLLKIYRNNQLIMSDSEQKSLGRIIGIRIMFEGAGQVQKVLFETPNKMAYNLMN
jgi:hypothetical protein